MRFDEKVILCGVGRSLIPFLLLYYFFFSSELLWLLQVIPITYS